MTQPSDRGVEHLAEEQPVNPALRVPDFATARSLKCELLEELRASWENGIPVQPEDILSRWPGDPDADPDVASLLFEEYCQRQEKGLEPAPEEYERRFPLQKESLASVLRQQAVVRAFSGASGRSHLTLALPTVGDELFGFRLRAELGRGAFARVFLAEQHVLAGRSVVLKVSAIEGDEPQTLAQLQHTHIVPIYSVHEDSQAGLRAVCMPFFGGASLAQVLQALWAETDRPTRGAQLLRALAVVRCSGDRVAGRGRPRAGADREATPNGPSAFLAQVSYLRAAAALVARLAEALQHAHQRGVLHRDIKPSNILLADDGQPMLLDFNLAQNFQSSLAQANATLGGTVAYMAPEHLRALATRDPALARHIDQRADIYALGMVLYELLTGHRPFDQSASYSPLPAIIEAMAVERSRTVPSLRDKRRDIPWGLESILRTCLAPEPAHRYQQAEHLAEDLRRLLEDRPLRYAPEPSWVERFQKWTRRHPRVAAAGSIAAAAAVLLTVSAGTLIHIQGQLQAAQVRADEAQGAQARQRQLDFETKTVRALCLIHTASDLHDHVAEGLAVCEQALELYQILERPDWQAQPDWQRLEEAERRRLAEDARELLLLLAGARVYLAPRQADAALPQTLAAFLAPLNPPASPVTLPACWQVSQTLWGPKADALVQTTQAALRQALQLLDRAEAIGGLDPSRALWQDRAFYWQQLGAAAAGEAAAEQARLLPPAGPRDHYLMATTYARQRHYAEAIGELSQALGLNPRHYWSWLLRGLCHQEIGEDAQALADFTACVALWPEFAWGYFNCGRVLHQMGRPESAERQYSAALACDRDFADARLNRGLIYLDLGRPARALADFDAAAAQGRDDPLLHGGRGMALESLGRFAEADSAFAKLWARDPDNVPLLVGYGFAICRRCPEAARDSFARVLARDPRNPRALYGQAMLLEEHGRGSGQALELLNRALQVDPLFVAGRRARALVLAHRGSSDEARQEIDWCVAAEPTGMTLYGAACVYALAAETSRHPLLAEPLANRALAFLGQALARGYGQDVAWNDPDLAGIRQYAEFRRLLQPAPTWEP